MKVWCHAGKITFYIVLDYIEETFYISHRANKIKLKFLHRFCKLYYLHYFYQISCKKLLECPMLLKNFNLSTTYQLCINYLSTTNSIPKYKQDFDFSLFRLLKVYKYIDIKVCLMLSYCTS